MAKGRFPGMPMGGGMPGGTGGRMPGGMGGAMAGGLGSAMGGEFDINPNPAPTNLDKQAPLNDEVPF